MCSKIDNMSISRIIFLDDDLYLNTIYKSLLKNTCPGADLCGGGICDYCYRFHDKIEPFLKDVQKNDIVILDYILGDVMNGLDIAESLRNTFGNTVYIILYSAFMFEGSKAESERLKYVDKIVTKPNFKKIIELIKEREKLNEFSLQT